MAPRRPHGSVAAGVGAPPGIRATILYMLTLPLAEARAQLSKLVDEAVRTHERIEVTKNGRRAAVILSADDYDSLMETLDILGDAEAMAAIREAESLTDDQWIPGEVVQAELRASGRLRS
jgi:antitoxin YefM